MLLIQKFGGSSLADRERLRRAAEIALAARREGQRLVVVVSAAGDDTDELIDLAHAIDPAPPLREMDALLSTGEQRSAALMAIQLGRLGAPARSFAGWQAGIHTDERHGGARIRHIAPRRLEAALDAGLIAVTAGFQGVTTEGDLSTLGRGGSDTTAVALAAAMGADRCEIYTDVDGVFTADPRLIPEARRLERIDSRDMLALALGGSQVLHPESVRLAMDNDVDVRLLSSFRPGPGTAVRRLKNTERPSLAGVTRDRERSTVTLAGRAAGFSLLPMLTARLGERSIPVLQSEESENALTLCVPPEKLDEALRLLHAAVVAF
ncbi:MAG: aspartate kinase [Oscillospiraceae bacterium]|nr:aspartate kinase [Oscillospiraceae bacterium]